MSRCEKGSALINPSLQSEKNWDGSGGLRDRRLFQVSAVGCSTVLPTPLGGLSNNSKRFTVV